jgi:hypothetical protein
MPSVRKQGTQPDTRMGIIAYLDTQTSPSNNNILKRGKKFQSGKYKEVHHKKVLSIFALFS